MLDFFAGLGLHSNLEELFFFVLYLFSLTDLLFLLVKLSEVIVVFVDLA